MAAACSPALDWREMQPPGARLVLAMPCRPATQQRELELAGQRVALTLWACETHGATFALGHAELAHPSSVAVVLGALGQAAQRNVRGHIELDEPAAVPGMTPQAAARRWRLTGQLPDGRAVTSWVTVFAYGPHVYQATVVGAVPDEAMVRHFHAALAVRP